MKTLLSLLVGFFFVSQISAQDMGDNSQDAWMSFMQPGEMHQLLAKQVGEWNVELKMWMDPSAPPEVSSGTVECEMILGGRYLKTTEKGTAMGMPMEGMGIDGYDNVKKKFVSIWIDNFGTGIATMEGDYDPETKTLTSTGTMTDPASGADSEFKMVVTYVDDDTTLSEMFTIMGDQEVKMMEMKSTRIKM